MGNERLFSKQMVHRMEIADTPARIFPLLCPVLEKLWLPGWSADIIHSESGVAELGCVFTTREAGGIERLWIASRFEPEAGAVQYVQFVAGLCVVCLDIALRETPGGCTLIWTHTVRGLAPGREDFFASYSDAILGARMVEVEGHLAAYLAATR